MHNKAKVLDEAEFEHLLKHVSTGVNAARDRTMLMFSFKCGLRSCEIARIRWSDVKDASGVILPPGTWIDLPKHITKNQKANSRILMHPDLYEALVAQSNTRGAHSARTIFYTGHHQDEMVSVNALTVYMHRLYNSAGLVDCSSHTGRRTYITKLARVCNLHGSSIKDVQLLARHSDIRTTEAYIEPATRIINLAVSA